MPTPARVAAVPQASGHVATITYNRPEALNAVNGELRQELNAAWDRFRGDGDAWVAILTGAGRAFCAGADMRDGAGSTEDAAGGMTARAEGRPPDWQAR